MSKRASLVLTAFFLGVASLPMLAGGELYGTITTRDGRELTGPIRWDRNENYWNDSLDATKQPMPKKQEEKRGFRMSLFGVKLGGGSDTVQRAFSIPFGHLSSVERKDPDEVVLKLKGGEELIVRGGSDVGNRMRGFVIEDAEAGRVKLSWRQFQRVQFRQAPDSERDGERLYGTVRTRFGEHVGFIIWDRDEALGEHILTGSQDGESHDVAFSDIKKIERLKQGGSRVTLHDDTELVLRGTNDVDDGHRGVAVTVDGIGVISYHWEDFLDVTFQTPPASPTYADFDGGTRIRGKVTTRSGQQLSGDIVWDLDESWDWETLDAEEDGIDYAIPFANIRSVRRLDHRRAEVTLVDGQTIQLEGSNDVNDENRGLLVEAADGNRVELAWNDVKSVELE